MADPRWHYAPRVLLPRRVKADLADGAIAAVVMFGPVLLGQALTGLVPAEGLRAFSLGIPLGVAYTMFRDAVGGGTSLGKRLLGLRVIALADGRPCGAGGVWARNLVDPIPLVGTIDFLWMCFDRHGQKLMDRWCHTQVVEVDALREPARVPADVH